MGKRTLEMHNTDFAFEKKQTIRAARELCYDKHVIDQLKKARSSYELSRIMMKARVEKD